MTKKPTFSVRLAKLPCACGGVLQPFKLQGKYDASIELGISAVVRGAVFLLKCNRCGGLSLAGSMLDALSDEAVLLLLKLDRCLSGGEARFLRKAALAIGQEELARALGLTRVTVARWECGQSLSPPHDFQLRGLVLGRLCKAGRFAGRWKKRREELTALIPVLEAARTAQAPRSPPPLQLAA
ncbi:MAG TPA: hypothetical protein VGK67_05320 [Myxococcales bacterium]|jgi:DNA-binding transcriptional regulator YiaG